MTRASDKKDATTQTAWTKGQHTDSETRGEDLVHAKPARGGNWGTAIRSWSIRWNAEPPEAVVVTDQLSAIQTRVRRTSGEFLGRKDGMRIEYSVPRSPDGSDKHVRHSSRVGLDAGELGLKRQQAHSETCRRTSEAFVWVPTGCD